jgi:hypothetical protein
MHLRPRHRLALPALLTATALGGCPGDDTDDDSATSVADTSSESSAGPTTDPSSSESSTDPTVTTDPSESSTSESGSTSVADTGTDGGSSSITDTGSTGDADCFGDGSMPACDVTEQAECEAVDICLWSEPGYCSANCTVITDAQTCCEQFECAWMGDACDYNAI